MNIPDFEARGRARLFGLPHDLEERIAAFADGDTLRSLRLTNSSGAAAGGAAVRTLRPAGSHATTRSVRAFPHATTLDLSGVRDIDDARSLRALQNLRRFDASGCYRLAAGDFEPQDFPRLESVRLGYSSLATNAVFRRLIAMKTLKKMDLRLSLIDDGAFDHLPGDASLTELRLNGCANISETGVRNLLKLPNLRVLDLSQCRQLDAERVREIFSRRPEVELLTAECTGEQVREDKEAGGPLEM